jgi:uncharacterized membrane protein
LVFADELTAFSLRETLWKMEDDSVIDVDDAVVVTRDKLGKIRLHQSLPLVTFGSAVGSVSGMILGMMVLNPLFGSVAGAAVGASVASLADVGINDEFMKELGETLKPSSSALFVTIRRSKPELVLDRLLQFAGSCKILQCDMPARNEVLLRNLLEGTVDRMKSAATKPSESAT